MFESTAVADELPEEEGTVACDMVQPMLSLEFPTPPSLPLEIPMPPMPPIGPAQPADHDSSNEESPSETSEGEEKIFLRGEAAVNAQPPMLDRVGRTPSFTQRLQRLQQRVIAAGAGMERGRYECATSLSGGLTRLSGSLDRARVAPQQAEHTVELLEEEEEMALDRTMEQDDGDDGNDGDHTIEGAFLDLAARPPLLSEAVAQRTRARTCTCSSLPDSTVWDGDGPLPYGRRMSAVL